MPAGTRFHKKPTLKTAAVVDDLKGRWNGTIVCRNGRTYSADLAILTQSSKSARGEIQWAGSNTGHDTVSLAPNPAAEDPNAHVLVTANPQAYDYLVALEGKDILRGLSTGSEKCSVMLER